MTPPIIIREQESVGTEITRIWSGNERNPSLGEPFESYIEKKDIYSDQPDEAYFYEKDEAVAEEKIVPVKPTKNKSPSSDAESTDPPLKSLQEEYQASESSIKQEEPADKSSREGPPRDVASRSKSDELNYFWPETVPYSIHVNSFPEKILAEERVKELSKHEYDSYLVYVHVPSMGYYYRIFVGQFDSRESAESFCEKLKGRKEFAKDIHVANRKWAFGG